MKSEKKDERSFCVKKKNVLNFIFCFLKIIIIIIIIIIILRTKKKKK